MMKCGSTKLGLQLLLVLHDDDPLVFLVDPRLLPRVGVAGGILIIIIILIIFHHKIITKKIIILLTVIIILNLITIILPISSMLSDLQVPSIPFKGFVWLIS